MGWVMPAVLSFMLPRAVICEMSTFATPATAGLICNIVKVKVSLRPERAILLGEVGVVCSLWLGRSQLLFVRYLRRIRCANWIGCRRKWVCLRHGMTRDPVRGWVQILILIERNAHAAARTGRHHTRHSLRRNTSASLRQGNTGNEHAPGYDLSIFIKKQAKAISPRITSRWKGYSP